MTQKQKNLLIGMILGDAYLQKTGKQNARIRLEHSIKQREYLDWKVSLLKNYFQSKIQILERANAFWNKEYQYARIQSTSSPEFGKLQRFFYKQVKKTTESDSVDELTHEPERANYSQANLLVKLEDTTALAVELHRESMKIIPEKINIIFISNLSLAVWFMDDGYYYPRDKMSYIYIPNYDEQSIKNLLFSLKENFNLLPLLKRKKKGLVLVFSVNETRKLMALIKKFIIPSMQYKIPLDPVSTERKSDVRADK